MRSSLEDSDEEGGLLGELCGMSSQGADQKEIMKQIKQIQRNPVASTQARAAGIDMKNFQNVQEMDEDSQLAV